MKLEQFDGFQLYLRDEKDLWGYYQNGVYEPEETALIKKLVKANDICLDIGANIGYYTVLMAKQCKFLIAVEPEPENYDLLLKNIQLNKLNNVWSYENAIAGHTGYGYLYLCDASYGMHRTYQSQLCGNKTFKVNSFAIDDMSLGGFKIDFIKMDIEGSELGALQGMKKLLIKDMSTIVMEFHPPSIREYGANPKDVYDFMEHLGYEIDLVNPNIPQISYEKLLEETDNIRGGQNILCVK